MKLRIISVNTKETIISKTTIVFRLKNPIIFLKSFLKVQNEWFVFKNAHISLCAKSAMFLSFSINYTAAIVSSFVVVVLVLIMLN